MEINIGVFSIWHLIIVLTIIIIPIIIIIINKNKNKIIGDKENLNDDKIKINQDNFFIRYWKGNVSLPISYWLVNLVTTVLLFSFFSILASFLDSVTTFNPIIISISYSLAYLLLTVVIIWQTIGVMRSSINHIKNPNKLKIWGYLALVMISLGILQNFNTYRTSFLPILHSLFKMAFLNDPDIPSYKTTITENKSELKISGGIKKGLLKDIKKKILQNPSIKTINLESLGGRQGEAIDLYKFITNRNLNTVTNNECLSACTVVFAAGKNRWLGINGRLGFHSSSFEGMSEKDVNKGFEKIFLQINKEKKIPIKFLKKSNNIPSEDMWYPNIDELKANNYITSKFSLAKSSLNLMEKNLLIAYKELKTSLPKQLDKDTSLIDIKIKLNQVTLIHVLSKTIVARLNDMNNGMKILKDHVIKNACKSKDVVKNLELGVELNYLYLKSDSKSKLTSFKMPKKC